MAGGSCMCARLLLVLFMLPSGHCLYRQIPLVNTPGVTCSMSSILSTTQYRTSLDCNGAINGNTDTTWRYNADPNASCTFTTSRDASTYWQVNLGSSRNIRRISVYPVARYQNHIENVRVLIDNNEVSRFPSWDQVTYPQVFSVARNGQIIRLQQDASKFLGLCEVQVEDCQAGDFGTDCSQTCSTGCNNMCDTISGNCVCKNGWTGAQCQTRCQAGKYGQDCLQTCSVGCQGTCDYVNGTCTPCNTGYTGTRCEVCSSGYYKQGDNCVPCGAGCQGGTCDVTGHCTCKPGWQPTQCHNCEAGYYGPGINCTSSCGAGCQDSMSCDTRSGECECKKDQHWASVKCETCLAGFWGGNCSLTCGNCTERSCDQQFGTCKSCVPGWTGPACHEPEVKSSVVSGPPVGPVSGGVVGGAVALIVVVVVIVFTNRWRRSRGSRSLQTAEETGDRTGQERKEKAPEATVSVQNLSSGIVTYQPEQSAFDGSDHYDKLDRYVNPDDIKPYTSLQPNSSEGHTSRGMRTTARDKNVYEIPDVQYENTKRK